MVGKLVRVEFTDTFACWTGEWALAGSNLRLRTYRTVATRPVYFSATPFCRGDPLCFDRRAIGTARRCPMLPHPAISIGAVCLDCPVTGGHSFGSHLTGL